MISGSMRKPFLILFLTLSTIAGSAMAQTRKPIFREINVSTTDKKRKIELGGDLKQNVDIVIKSGDVFVLNGNFGNTARLAIRLNDAGLVREIIFDYRSDKDFANTVETYSKEFGKPSISQTLSSAIVKVRMVAWEDGNTRFEIVEKTDYNQTTVSSVLIDKKTK